MAKENLNALQQEYQRLLHLKKSNGDYETGLVTKITKLMASNENLEKELGQLRYDRDRHS